MVCAVPTFQMDKTCRDGPYLLYINRIYWFWMFSKLNRNKIKSYKLSFEIRNTSCQDNHRGLKRCQRCVIWLSVVSMVWMGGRVLGGGSARLLHHCIHNNHYPHCSADNTTSDRQINSLLMTLTSCYLHSIDDNFPIETRHSKGLSLKPMHSRLKINI